MLSLMLTSLRPCLLRRLTYERGSVVGWRPGPQAGLRIGRRPGVLGVRNLEVFKVQGFPEEPTEIGGGLGFSVVRKLSQGYRVNKSRG